MALRISPSVASSITSMAAILKLSVVTKIFFKKYINYEKNVDKKSIRMRIFILKIDNFYPWGKVIFPPLRLSVNVKKKKKKKRFHTHFSLAPLESVRQPP